MSIVKEFVEKLREKAAIFSKSDFAVAGIAKDYKDAADMIEKLAEEYNQGWIPCSERLPEDDGYYLVTRLGGNGIEVDISEYEHGYMYNNGFHKVFQVTAWMPLPEPYKPEQQKEIPTKHYEERFNKVM